VASPTAPRAAEPIAFSSNPATSARTRPKRAIRSAPGTAAIANSIGGRLDSQPIAVSDSRKSACKRGITGGIASTVSRRQAPASQSRTSGIRGDARGEADAEPHLPLVGGGTSNDNLVLGHRSNDRGWIAEDHHSIGHISGNDRARADEGIFADGDPRA